MTLLQLLSPSLQPREPGRVVLRPKFTLITIFFCLFPPKVFIKTDRHFLWCQSLLFWSYFSIFALFQIYSIVCESHFCACSKYVLNKCIVYWIWRSELKLVNLIAFYRTCKVARYANICWNWKTLLPCAALYRFSCNCCNDIKSV